MYIPSFCIIYLIILIKIKLIYTKVGAILENNRRKIYEKMLEDNARDIRSRAMQKRNRHTPNIHSSRHIKSSNMIKLTNNSKKTKKYINKYITICFIIAFSFLYLDMNNNSFTKNIISKAKQIINYDTLKNNIKETFSNDANSISNINSSTVIHDDILKIMQDEINNIEKK